MSGGLIAPIADGHIRPAAGECERDGPPNASPAAGDQRDPAFEIFHRLLRPRSPVTVSHTTGPRNSALIAQAGGSFWRKVGSGLPSHLQPGVQGVIVEDLSGYPHPAVHLP